ncbi:2-amino-4-hydroxy-6-hydroxymethyldihydropteridine diphosphokinase [Luteimonas granuli]|uniref:2-amino-4-hydroxy-6-hydroxymethyldihydropteridine pyrophosphokinase n=1 Tax=Luteimonas granuli TaxID=1176533 RepID=A0A518N3S8_9GAMM|nr:2-amino-4-hydroxy-6-hydroxymethyldihydropteridine diphosphokinase [Luteimonas granuli]QDW66572.1 2-amino-4-hydroxy-6-hydroxymethyldihydropteridine diphosphokinase [Luteimonas granuli]
MGRACLSLGSNVDPERHIALAFAALRARFGDILASDAYRTPAVGFDGADFVNAAAVVDSDLDVLALNDWLHALEDAHGRDRGGPRFGDRTLDIDIVLYDDQVRSGPGNLRLPRGELRHAFVLRPLAEIAPGVLEPVSGSTLAELWAASDERGVAMHRVTLPDVGGDAGPGSGHTPAGAGIQGAAP